MHRVCLAAVLLSAIALTGCWEGVTRQILASVLSTRGEVVYLRQGLKNFQPVSPESQLGANAILRTSNDGQIDLELIPGAQTRISGDSELKIGRLQITKDGNETGDSIKDRAAQVELRHGQMVVLFEGFARFQIDTAQAVITVLPSCVFLLEADESRTRLTCIRGKVYVTPAKGDRLPVDGGYVGEWPAARDLVPVAEDSRSEKAVANTLEVARELQDAAARHRDHLPGT